MFDFHVHSLFSDGLHTPAELVHKAVSAELWALALTDHDTVEGLPALHQAATHTSLQIIDGIEISARWKKLDIHIVGLGIDPQHSAMMQLITAQNTHRIARARLIGERLSACGVADAYEKASAIAGHARVGRPHFAQVCVNEGLVSDRQVAFKRFLGRGKRAFEPTIWVDVSEAVEAISTAGGIAVLAHPHHYKLTRTRLNELTLAFKEAGGRGLEVVSGAMMATQMAELTGLCTRHGLLASSGSDFHGDGISRVPLGRQQSLPVHCNPIDKQWTKG